MIINFSLYIVLFPSINIYIYIFFVFVKFYILCIVGPHQPFGCHIPFTTYLSNKVYLLIYLFIHISKYAVQKYPDSCGRDLSVVVVARTRL